MNKRRAIRKFIGGIGIGLLSVFAFVGDLTGNLGLWTLGGSVGMARATYMAFAYLAYDLFCDAREMFNGDWPFRKVEE